MADELISRQAALTWMDLLIEDSRKIAGKDKLILRVCDIQQGMRDMVAKLPAIDPASLRPKGEWLGSGDGFDPEGNMVFDMWECSECIYYIDTDEPDTLPNFCPNCGADMRGEKDG